MHLGAANLVTPTCIRIRVVDRRGDVTPTREE
jgi:hypothetical protein